MKWSKALKLAIPVWLLICAGALAINYAADVKATAGNLTMALAVAYPLTALILKVTVGDIAKWREAFGSKTDE